MMTRITRLGERSSGMRSVRCVCPCCCNQNLVCSKQNRTGPRPSQGQLSDEKWCDSEVANTRLKWQISTADEGNKQLNPWTSIA